MFDRQQILAARDELVDALGAEVVKQCPQLIGLALIASEIQGLTETLMARMAEAVDAPDAAPAAPIPPAPAAQPPGAPPWLKTR